MGTTNDTNGETMIDFKYTLDADNRIQLFRDHFQNYKRYHIPKAQLIIADIPYNIGNDAYGSNPQWYKNGSNKNGESKKANSSFFDTDGDFNIYEYMHFCSKMMVPEPKEAGKAPAMLIFCSFEQKFELIELAKRYGFNNYINLVFKKNYSSQVLKANMRIVGNSEYALLFYRDKLPKFNNNGQMQYNCIEYPKAKDIPSIHPTQKPIKLISHFIRLFTDQDDVIIDPCAGSGSTLVSALNLGREAYGFEIKRQYYNGAKELLQKFNQPQLL